MEQPSCTSNSEEEEKLIEVILEVAPQHHGWRLDRFIKERIPRLSRNRIQKMIAAQETLQGVAMRPADRVQALQQVKLLRPAPVEPDVQ